MGVIETALSATESGAQVFWVGGIDAYQINELRGFVLVFDGRARPGKE